MQFENPMTFCRAIKGAPASVLWALMFTQHMMTALELSEWTGYKGDNLTIATRLLVNLGWVVARSPRGPWGLADGRQLPLMPGIEQLSGFENPDSDLIGVGDLLSSSSSLNHMHSTTEELLKEEQETNESDLIGFVKENLAACDNAGIREPKRTLISRLIHVTPDYIEGHTRQAQSEGVHLGTAIHRIQYNWSVDPRFLQEKQTFSWMCKECNHVLTACICEEID